MDSDYKYWYGVKAWKQIDLFGADAFVDILQDDGHIILKETEKFLCKHRKETIMKKMGVEKERVVSMRIENTKLCSECFSEYVAREATHRKMPIKVTYEVASEKLIVGAQA